MHHAIQYADSSIKAYWWTLKNINVCCLTLRLFAWYLIIYTYACMYSIINELYVHFYVLGIALAEKIQGLEDDYPHVCLTCGNNPGCNNMQSIGFITAT